MYLSNFVCILCLRMSVCSSCVCCICVRTYVHLPMFLCKSCSCCLEWVGDTATVCGNTFWVLWVLAVGVCLSQCRSPSSLEVSEDTPPVKPEEVRSPKPAAPPSANKEDLRAMARKQLTRVLQARCVCVCVHVRAHVCVYVCASNYFRALSPSFTFLTTSTVLVTVESHVNCDGMHKISHETPPFQY